MPKLAAASHFQWQRDYNDSTVLSRSRQRGAMAVCLTLGQRSRSGEVSPLPLARATTLAPIRSPLRLTQHYTVQSRLTKLLRAPPSTCTEAIPKPAAMATQN